MQQIDFERLAQDALFTEETISFDIQDAELNLIFCQGKTILMDWAKKLNKQKVILRGSMKEIALPVGSTSNPESQVIKAMPTAEEVLMYSNFDPNHWSAEWLRLAEAIASNDKPQVLIQIDGQYQRWCNQKFADVMRSGGNEVCQRTIIDFWEQADLQQLDTELQTGSDFEITYQARLNDAGLHGRLKAHNQILELNGVFFRLSTNLECQLLKNAVQC